MFGRQTKLSDEEIAEQIAVLAPQTRADDTELRRSAAEKFWDLCLSVRERARGAIPTLIDCLSDIDDKVGESAASGLHWCSPDSIEPLIECLDSASARVRKRACQSLASIGDAAHSASLPLRRLLADSSDDVRLKAAFALGLIHETSDGTIQALLAMTRSTNVEEKHTALHALGNIGTALPDPQPLRTHQDELLEALEHDNRNVRWSACYVLESLHLDPARHADLLLRRLEVDTEERVLSSAIDQLKTLAPTVDLAEHVELIAGPVSRPDRRLASNACVLLALLGEKAKPAVPFLIDALRRDGDDGSIAIAAARALWKINSTHIEDILPALERLFDDYDHEVCDTISIIGPAAAPLIGKLITALQTEEDWDLQWAAADALGAVASSEPRVLDALTTALAHDSPIVTGAAARALVKIGAPAVPKLIEIVADREDRRGKWAADILGSIGVHARAAADALRARLRGTDPTVAAWCAVGLAKVAGDVAAMPVLINALGRDDYPYLQAEAVNGLKAIGPPAREAVGALMSLRDSDDAAVRAAVEEALAALNAKPN